MRTLCATRRQRLTQLVHGLFQVCDFATQLLHWGVGSHEGGAFALREPQETGSEQVGNHPQLFQTWTLAPVSLGHAPHFAAGERLPSLFVCQADRLGLDPARRPLRFPQKVEEP